MKLTAELSKLCLRSISCVASKIERGHAVIHSSLSFTSLYYKCYNSLVWFRLSYFVTKAGFVAEQLICDRQHNNNRLKKEKMYQQRRAGANKTNATAVELGSSRAVLFCMLEWNSVQELVLCLLQVSVYNSSCSSAAHEHILVKVVLLID